MKPCTLDWLFVVWYTPVKKVMGLFFRHELFIFYFFAFYPTFIREVVDMNYANFFCLIYAICMDDSEAWGKRPLLAWCRNGDGWYKLLQIIENLSSYTNRFHCDLLGMGAVERSYPRPLAGRLFYRLCLRSLCYRNKDASDASRDCGTVYQARSRPSANVDTFVQPRSQNPGHRTNRG